MPKTRQEKEKIVQDLAQKFSRATSVVFTNFQGLKVKDTEELRKMCRQEDIEYLVAKKTLIQIALEKVGLKEINPRAFPGEIATVFGSDEIMPAKVLDKFSADHEALKIIGGILEGKFINRERVLSLAGLPTKSELLSKMVGSLKAPISGLVNVFKGNLRGLVRILSIWRENKS